MILTHLVLFSFLGGASDAAAPAPPPAPTGPTPAGRHRRRQHEGRKRYAVEIDGHLVIADTKAELARKVQALRPTLPEFQPEEPIEVPVAQDDAPAPEKANARKTPRRQEKLPAGLPEVSEPVDLGLAREAAAASRRARQAKESTTEAKRIAAEAQQQVLEARIREQEEYAKRLAAIQADDDAVIELFLQILNSEDD